MPLALIFVCVLVSWPRQVHAFTRFLLTSQENSSPQAPSNPAPNTPAPSAPSQTPNSESTTKNAPLPAPASKKPHKKKPSSQTASGPSKRVVRNGSTADPTVQIAPEVGKKQASSQLQNTNQLLAATEGNLKTIAERGPTSSQQSVIQQIRQYMDQAKQAADQGDPQRAHNLALKAHLLSEDLVKQ